MNKKKYYLEQNILQVNGLNRLKNNYKVRIINMNKMLKVYQKRYQDGEIIILI